LKEDDILEKKRLHQRVVATLILFTGAALISHSHLGLDLTPADFQGVVDVKDQFMDLFSPGPEGLEGGSRNLSGGIYGEPSLAVLQEAKLELQLYPGSGPGSRAKETAPMEHLFQTSPLGQGVAVPADVYIESLPAQHKEIIKRYFENLAKD
jgi:hypothetical protein